MVADVHASCYILGATFFAFPLRKRVAQSNTYAPSLTGVFAEYEVVLGCWWTGAYNVRILDEVVESDLAIHWWHPSRKQCRFHRTWFRFQRKASVSVEVGGTYRLLGGLH